MAVKEKEFLHDILSEEYIRRKKRAEKQNHWTLSLPSISRQQVSYITQYAPDVVKSPAHFSLMVLLSYGTPWTNKETGDILLPCQQLATLAGKPQGHCNTGEFLEEYKKLDPEFDYRNYYYQGHEVRRVKTYGTHDLFWKMLSTNNRCRQHFSLETGLEITSREERRLFEKLCKKLEKEGESEWKYESQRLIALYHHTQYKDTFYALIDQNYDDAFSTAVARGDAAALQLLHRILTTPGICFSSSIVRRTSRMFDNAGIWGMKKYLKNIFFRGCHDIDMKYCQLTIVAYLLDIKPLIAFLEGGIDDLWVSLCDYMEIPKKYRKEAKEGLKKAIYSLIYGMARGQIEKNLKIYLEWKEGKKRKGLKVEKTLRQKHGISLKKIRNLTNHPLLLLVWESITQKLEDIKRDGGMLAADGTKIEWHPGIKPEQVFSCAVQSYEQHIISGVYELALQERARGHERYAIVNSQFDGVTIKIHEGENEQEVEREIAKTIMNKAREVNMKMRIETKKIGENKGTNTKGQESSSSNDDNNNNKNNKRQQHPSQFTPKQENTPDESTPDQDTDDSQNEKSIPEDDEEMSFLAMKKQLFASSCAEDDAEMHVFLYDDENEEEEYDLLE